MGEYKIVTVEHKKDEQFLRKKTEPFDFAKFNRREISGLISRMRNAMKFARGIGLSANQIGLNMRVFVAQIPPTRTRTNLNTNKHESAGSKFYAVFNPEIVKYSREKAPMEEGCLSVPGVYGAVERPEKIAFEGYDRNGKKIKIKAWGLLAKVFQHEVDHLNGTLFVDRAKELYKVPVSERLKEKQE